MDVLVTYPPLCGEARAVLEGAGHRILSVTSDCFSMAAWLPGQVLWVRLEKVPVYRLDGLKVLVTNCTGLDHVPLDECARRNIRVLSLRDCREAILDISSTAEHAVLLMLALLRNLPAAVEHTRKGGWDRWQFVGRELRGKNVGIIGHGRIGQQVGRIVQAFGGTVLALPEDNYGWADIISVHCDLNPTTCGMFNAERFAQMKPGALLVNTARGAIVDEAALLDALRSGRLAGAALDVLTNEPETEGHPLFQFAFENPGRLIVTPHIGGATVEGLAATELALAKVLVESLCEAQ